MIRALGQLQIKALNEQCGAVGGEERDFLEMDFKGQEVHLNPDSHSHSMGCQVRKQDVLDK